MSRTATEFGELIRSLRVLRGLSQRGLAERIGTTQSAIARLESGCAEPKIGTLERLAGALEAELTFHVDGRAAS